MASSTTAPAAAPPPTLATDAAMEQPRDGQVLYKVAIKYCTQCKWMLRAAYFAQELLSTFSLALAEVSLQPSTGGVFTVSITSFATGVSAEAKVQVLWDRKEEGGFPEVKELKRRVRDVVQPGRDLGHVDGKGKARSAAAASSASTTGAAKAEAEAGEGEELCACVRCLVDDDDASRRATAVEAHH